MRVYKYVLEKYSGSKSRTLCPKCGKKEYVRYIDTETSGYLPIEYGKCNRDINCGYWKNPYKERFNEVTNFDISSSWVNTRKIAATIQKESPSYHDCVHVVRSMSRYDNNSFVVYLLSIFGFNKCKALINEYFIGTSKHWNNLGACIFWQIDFWGNVRAGKVMAYSPITGKRLKDPFNHITWVHKLLGLEEFKLSQVYFGEHLLRQYVNKPVAIVESEKTAIISSAYFPEYVWLAAGNLRNITVERSQFLFQRDVVLFPDLSKDGIALSLWQKKAKELEGLVSSIQIFDVLEKLATIEEKESGWDIVDFLTRYKLEEWDCIEDIGMEVIELNEYGYPSSWDRINKWENLNSESKLQKMKRLNPAIEELIHRFSLLEI